MSSGHLLLSCAKRAATTKIDLFAYLWQLPCALFRLILMTLLMEGAYQNPEDGCSFILSYSAGWMNPRPPMSMYQTLSPTENASDKLYFSALWTVWPRSTVNGETAVTTAS